MMAKKAQPKTKTAAKPKVAKPKAASPKTAKPKKDKSAAERIAEPIKNAGKAMRDNANKAMANTTALNTKVIDHAEANAREAFAAMRRVASAKSLQDIVKVQSEFVKQQSARTATQAREVGEMIAGFGRDAFNLMRGK